LVIVADASKQVKRLGKFPLPVEVIKFAEALVTKKIRALGADVKLRMDGNKPYLSDENNHILDCSFGEIADPERLACTLSQMPGVVEHGMFLGMASVALLARGSEIIELRR
jgi:ribose 5-phosphate isomerase A